MPDERALRCQPDRSYGQGKIIDQQQLSIYSGCTTSRSFYGDAELWMGLYYYNPATSQFDTLVASAYTPLRLDMSTAFRANLDIVFKNTMPAGRYRVELWARQHGVTDWQYTLIDFNANDNNLPRGHIDYHVDRCGNPLAPDCGISPRYVVAGWACNSPIYGGALDTSKLTITRSAFLSTDYNHPKYALAVYSRPDVVVAGLCSNNAVGFSYEYNGQFWNPGLAAFDTFEFYYAGVKMTGKQVPDGYTVPGWNFCTVGSYC